MKDTDKTILLVDDDSWLTDQFAHSIQKKLRYNVVTAPNGIAAMDSIDVKRPDAIVLDISMPGPNGIVLLHEMQSHDDLASIPIILCSNSASELSMQDMSHYGVKAMLDKSTMHPEDLESAILKVLG